MPDSTESLNDYPIPPASFPFLVESVIMQTQMQLGLLNFDKETNPDPEPNLPLARHSIDMLAMLQEKTRGNLSLDEQRMLENGLTELRFRYVQVAELAKKKNEPKIVEAASSPAPEDVPRIITADGGKGTKTS